LHKREVFYIDGKESTDYTFEAANIPIREQLADIFRDTDVAELLNNFGIA
jgi:hypothetical protein